AHAALYHGVLPRVWLSRAKVVAGLCIDTALVTEAVRLSGDDLSLLVFLYYVIVVTSALTLGSRALLGMCAVITTAYAAMLALDDQVRASPGAHAAHAAVFVASVWLVALLSWAGAFQIQRAELRRVEAVRAQNEVAAQNARLSADLAERLSETRALAASLERQRSETKRLADMVIRAQEEERRRVSRELHDEANQTLAALMATADLAEAQAEGVGDPALVATVARLRRLASTTLDGLQRLALELRPPALDEFGLVPALSRHVAERTAGTALRADVATEGRRRRLPEAVEAALYRIAQEALANSQKHSGARTVHLRLRFATDAVRLDVSDDGAGFDPLALEDGLEAEGVAAGRSRLGLAGMRERASIVGGTVEVTSRPGGGTRVTAVIPMDAAGPTRDTRGAAA
ncbi:MAG TPA: sensor histidine kinase, partial [Candidatus Dormibacteraeota bacterium]|nr:sensor histidine kinase [Candidatus Dormibacteraeota bacterium]